MQPIDPNFNIELEKDIFRARVKEANTSKEEKLERKLLVPQKPKFTYSPAPKPINPFSITSPFFLLTV